MEAEKLSTLRGVRRRLQPGKASDYISHIDDLPPGCPVVVIARESSDKNAGHLAPQSKGVADVVRAKGGKVVAERPYVVLGYDPDEGQPSGSTAASWSGAIADYANLARRLGAVLVAESTDRFVRHPGFSTNGGKSGKDYKWPDARARTSDLEELKFLTEGVQLFTVVAPDADADVVTAHRTRRGMAQSRAARGGRPKKKVAGHRAARRAKLLPQVLKLKAAGASLRDIERKTGVPAETVRRWLKKAK